VQKNDPKAGFFRRQIQSAGTGESAFSTIFRGNGEVWTELTHKHFIIAEMDGPGDACCSTTRLLRLRRLDPAQHPHAHQFLRHHRGMAQGKA
jgi:uncharacterized protein (AIM24 family)